MSIAHLYRGVMRGVWKSIRNPGSTMSVSLDIVLMPAGMQSRNALPLEPAPQYCLVLVMRRSTTRKPWRAEAAERARLNTGNGVMLRSSICLTTARIWKRRQHEGGS